jgi:hypothetical protein
VPPPLPTCSPCATPNLLLKYSDAILATYKKENKTIETWD